MVVKLNKSSKFVTHYCGVMISTLVTSRTRIKLLKKFFINYNTSAHLRGLEGEFNESSNSIRIELNRFEVAGLLKSFKEGNKKFYQANIAHPLFREIHNITIKEIGIDKIIEQVLNEIGKIESIYLTGDFARGIDSTVIEIIMVGLEIDLNYVERKISQAEKLVGRRIKCQVFKPVDSKEYFAKIGSNEVFQLWSSKELRANKLTMA